MKRKDRGRGSREKMWFCEKKEKINKEKRKRERGSDIMWWGQKWVGKEASLKLPSLQISLQYDLITKES